MTRGSKKRRIERLKSALIVLLSCSAVFLLVRTQAAIVSSEDSGTAYQAEAEGSSSTESPGATARPLRMAAAIQRGSEVVRYGVQYDQESTDSLYQQSYSLLVEALSSASQPRAVGETEFQQALSTAPGLYFDWQGEIPVAVLNGWLSVDNQTLTGTVRRMVLTAVEGQVLLYYWDESADQGWVCTSDVISSSRLNEAVGALQENGTVFAFETEELDTLAPYTMVQTQTPVPVVYSASNPIAGEDRRQALQEQLGFPENSISYPAAGEYVIRSRNDTLHIAEDGRVTYEAAAEGSDRYRLSGTGVYEAVEGCRRLAQQTLGQNSGEATLYLLSVEGERGRRLAGGVRLQPQWGPGPHRRGGLGRPLHGGTGTDYGVSAVVPQLCGQRNHLGGPSGAAGAGRHGGQGTRGRGAASGLSGRRGRGTGLRFLGGRPGP